MRLNKNIQYGLLFTLYICRAGRASVQSAAEGLGVSYPLLSQVATKLRRAKVIKSIRGPGGGYELTGEPSVLEVFQAVSPIKLLKDADTVKYNRGGDEARSLVNYVSNLGYALAPLLKRKVRNVGAELVAAEMLKLEAKAPTGFYSTSSN